MKNLTLSKEKSPKRMSHSFLHPALVATRYFDGQACSPPHEGQGCCTDCNLNTDWTVFFSVLDHLYCEWPFQELGPLNTLSPFLCLCSTDASPLQQRHRRMQLQGWCRSHHVQWCTKPQWLHSTHTDAQECHHDFWARTTLLGGISPSAQKFAAGLWLFLLFVCFTISLLIILKKKSVCVLLKVTNPYMLLGLNNLSLVTHKP